MKLTKNKKKRTRKVKKKKGGSRNTNAKHTAIIIEPRKHKAVSFVLKNILENLDDTWNVIIHHGTLNEDYVKGILERDLSNYRNRISLENLGVDDLPRKELNRLLLDHKFLEKIPTEKFIFFQTDSMINPNNKHLLEKFMNYDYVGAPFTSVPLDECIKFLNLNIPKVDLTKEGFVGNGGFSFRKKSKMLEVLKDLDSEIINTIVNEGKYGEDLIFSLGTNNVKVNKPTFEMAKEFSMEQAYVPKVFALHAPWKNLNENELNMLKNDCPGLDTLISLQGSE